MSFAAGASDFFGIEVGWYFEFYTAGAGQENEAVNHSHDVADLMRLLGFCFWFLGLLGGRAQVDMFFLHGGFGDDGSFSSYRRIGI